MLDGRTHADQELYSPTLRCADKNENESELFSEEIRKSGGSTATLSRTFDTPSPRRHDSAEDLPQRDLPTAAYLADYV